jgi:hypothetical protein
VTIIDFPMLAHSEVVNLARLLRGLRVPVPRRRAREDEQHFRLRLAGVALRALEFDAERAALSGGESAESASG